MPARVVVVALLAAGGIGFLAGMAAPSEADLEAGRRHKPSAKVVYALVREDGLLFGGKGAVNAERTVPGTYFVTFDRPVDRCAPVATSLGQTALISTFAQPDPTIALVHTFTATGDAADRSFALQAAC